MAIKWTQEADEYYTARGFSGIALTIESFESREEGLHGPVTVKRWRLFAGDQVEPRAIARNRREIKRKAEMMFG